MSGPIYADRVKETTATTGTGTYTLAGATTGFQSFAAIGDGNTCYYGITDGTAWEVGLGTYTSAGTTLARTAILASSNSNAAVSWSAGAKSIWGDSPALFFTGLVNSASALSPATSDGHALGTSALQWSDLFGASGFVWNIAAGDWVATHTTGIVTVGTGDLRVTNAGANAASVVTVGGTQTLTAKTLTSPVLNTATVGTSLLPTNDDGAPLGSTTKEFSDLFLASGGVINWANGNATITHSSGLLTFNVPVSLGTSNAITVGSIELGAASDTTITRSAAGVIAVEGVPLYSNIPQNSQSAAYTTVLADAQKHLLHPTADNNARTFTIDSNANVAYPIGTAITFVNEINTLTIAITSDTLVLAGVGTTGSRTLGPMGMATAIKKTTTSWIISGAGLT